MSPIGSRPLSHAAYRPASAPVPAVARVPRAPPPVPVPAPAADPRGLAQSTGFVLGVGAGIVLLLGLVFALCRWRCRRADARYMAEWRARTMPPA